MNCWAAGAPTHRAPRASTSLPEGGAAPRRGIIRGRRFSWPVPMPLLKALCAQLAGLALVYGLLQAGLARYGTGMDAGRGPGRGACATAMMLGSERWWWLIHLMFTPLLLLAGQLGIAPGWYLGLFILLSLVSGALSAPGCRSSFPTERPSTRSRRGLPTGPRGSCWTSAAASPACCGRWQGAFPAGASSVSRAPAAAPCGTPARPRPGEPAAAARDFFARDWGDFAVVYAFLSPVPMQRVGEKAFAEMRGGSTLISNSFALPERTRTASSRSQTAGAPGSIATRSLKKDSKRPIKPFCSHPARRPRGKNVRVAHHPAQRSSFHG